MCGGRSRESCGGVTGEPEREEVEMVEDHAEIEDEDVDEGHRKVKHMYDPELPSSAEVLEHHLTHLLYRTWCPHCIKGRGKETKHATQKVDAEPTVDSSFPGDEMGQRLTLLVVVERHTKMEKAIVVPSKGSTERYAARQVLDLIEECRDKDQTIILKFLVDDVCMARTGAKTIVDRAPVVSKGSNGSE